METRVPVLRLLRDASTSVVVQVLHSNAVLKCEVTRNHTKNLEPGQTATLRVLAYEPPLIRVSIADNSAGTGTASATKLHANTGSEKQLRNTTATPRKRMRFSK